MAGSIRLHPKFGLNPTMPVCIICGKEKGEIALLGASYRDQTPMHMIVGVEPCDTCREKYLGLGVLLVEGKGEHHTPTSSIAVIKTEAFQKIFNTPVPERHIAIVEEGVLQKIGVFEKPGGK